ncbi:MAG: FAD-dependent monooxygenase [Proteobacteria bacterium]|nr:FAD-dependent monooxygenase [Pseudomonadota bacterium]
MVSSRGSIGVIGGSIAGLMAALVLRRKGYDVNVFERSEAELATRGAGITPHQPLFDAFKQADIEIEDAMGVTSRGRLFLTRDGRIADRNETPQLFTSWGLLYRFLRKALPNDKHHNGANLASVCSNESSVQATFSDDSTHTFDWLIGADGSRSTVRNFVAPHAQLRYSGYVAWRGLLPESELHEDIAAQLNDRMTFYLPPGEHMLGYTVAGPNDSLIRGHRWYNWVWYRPVAIGEDYASVFTDASGNYHVEGIPPPLIRADILAAMRADAQRLLPPQFRAVVGATPQPFLQPIVELGCASMIYQRTILIGDAAFTVRPHIGLGVSKAAEDAATLAQAFSQDGQDLGRTLVEWDAARVGFGSAALRRSADLGCYLGSTAQSADEIRRFEYFRRSDIVLAGVAAADPHQFLQQ